MNEQKNELSGIADALALYGRGGDTKLMHVTQNEIDSLGALMPGGKMPVNPYTGLPEAAWWDFLTPIGNAITSAGSTVWDGLGYLATGSTDWGGASGIYGALGSLGDWATGSPAVAAAPAVVPGLATAGQAAVPAFGGYGPALLGAGILGVNYLANRPEEGEDEIPIEEYDFSDYEAIDRFGELAARPVKEDGTPYTNEERIRMDREIDRRHFT
jgi:hypothetical protein